VFSQKIFGERHSPVFSLDYTTADKSDYMACDLHIYTAVGGHYRISTVNVTNNRP